MDEIVCVQGHNHYSPNPEKNVTTEFTRHNSVYNVQDMVFYHRAKKKIPQLLHHCIHLQKQLLKSLLPKCMVIPH